MRIMYISNHLRHTCGITSHLYYHALELKKYAGIEMHFVCGGGDAVKKFRDAGLSVTVVTEIMHETRTVAGYALAIIKLRKLVKEFRPDIMHSHHYFAANIAKVVAKFYKIPAVQTIHGLIPPIGKLPHFAADRYIAVNNHIIDELDKQKPGELGSIDMIPCGFPFEEINAARELNRPVKFITASRMLREKGIHTLIDAVRQNSNFGGKAEFTIAGDGEDLELFKQMAAGTNIHFLGAVPDLFERLGDYDILIHPTESLSEGFPTIIIQAAAKGLPVITTRFRGYDAVLNEELCLLSDPGDISGLSSNIAKAIHDNKMVYKQHSLLREKLVLQYNTETTTRQLLSYYLLLLRDRA